MADNREYVELDESTTGNFGRKVLEDTKRSTIIALIAIIVIAVVAFVIFIIIITFLYWVPPQIGCICPVCPTNSTV